MKYIVFDENSLYDFKDLILPDVYSQLLVTRSFKDAGIACIGVTEKRLPVGAIVLGFHQEPVVSVLSLYVRPDRRDHEIGSELISYATVLALNLCEFETSLPHITLCLEYALPEADAARFQSFLDKNRFTLRQDLSRVTVADADVCLEHLNLDTVPMPSLGIRSADTVFGADAEEFTAFLEDNGFNADAEFCFILGKPEDPACVLIAEYGDDQDFYVSSVSPRGPVSADDYRALLSTAVRAIGAKYPRFALIAEDIRNVCPEVWQELSESGERAVRGAAVLAADFE